MAAATTRSGRKLPSIRTLWAIAKSPELGLTDEDLHGVVYRETGKGSMKQLTQGEITAVARVLQNMKDSAARGSRSKRTDEGGKSKPYTTQKALEKSQESHIGAVLFESETLLRNGSKTRYRDQEGAQKKRRKVFDRALAFTVIIGDYTDEAVESMFGAFLSSLDRGIYVNGDFVPIEVEGADWVDKDDSILKAQVAVQIKIRFDGGVYRDTDFAKVSDVAVESITKNEGKEFIDGE